jgi:hypothetical protein
VCISCYKTLYDVSHHPNQQDIDMQQAQQQSLFLSYLKILTSEALTHQAVTEMRPLTDDELRAVAGGPELEVDNGN